MQVIKIDSCSSTMDFAKVLLKIRELPFALVTDFQTDGRGRIGWRPWKSSPGVGLLFTYAFPVTGFDDVPTALSLRAGVALLRAIREIIPDNMPDIRIKWPNDVLIDGKKVSGILVECDGSVVYLGMGVNVLLEGASLLETATCLEKASGVAIDRFRLLNSIIFCLNEDIVDGTVDWLSILNENLFRKGESVQFESGPVGSAVLVQGSLTGIQEDGALLITPDGESEPRAFYTGELTWT
jgi:BirA family biotin operon repressor/biotin-[acetyl-CoA-carboxylase] ligase